MSFRSYLLNTVSRPPLGTRLNDAMGNEQRDAFVCAAARYAVWGV